MENEIITEDEYTMKHTCNWYHQDGSIVEYKIEDWVKMVYQVFPNGRKRKAQYENGKWINY